MHGVDGINHKIVKLIKDVIVLACLSIYISTYLMTFCSSRWHNELHQKLYVIVDIIEWYTNIAQKFYHRFSARRKALTMYLFVVVIRSLVTSNLTYSSAVLA